MNKVQLIGNLTKDVETKNTTTGKVVGNGAIATNRSYIDASGQKQQISQFHNFVVWNKQAEALAKWTKKGDKIYLEGELTHRSYDAQDGTKRYITEIVISGFEFLPNGRKPEEARSQQNNAPEEIPTIEVEEEDDEEIKVENIPF